LPVAIVAIIAALLVLAPDGGASHGRRAVIVDQLAATDPNQAFIDAATKHLRDAGYTVDYVPPDAVSIDLYRTLPSRGYDLVILRSHAAQYAQTTDAAGASTSRSVALFTNEPYSTRKYVDEQRKQIVTTAAYPYALDQRYFAIDATFLDEAMRGQFSQATVILMGCGGLSSGQLADAFVRRGVRHFVSWDDAVSAEFTDRATETLLAYMLDERQGPTAAAVATMKDIGPDPAFGSYLLSYP
jgi:hypothetical protein